MGREFFVPARTLIVVKLLKLERNVFKQLLSLLISAPTSLFGNHSVLPAQRALQKYECGG